MNAANNAILEVENLKVQFHTPEGTVYAVNGISYAIHEGEVVAVVGESENTARYAGISVRKVIIRSMLISGAICGLAGFVTVAGADHTLSETTAGGRGFTAIIVAWLA